MIIDQILRIAPPDTVIPKPNPKSNFVVRGEGIRREERALLYDIPNHKKPAKPHRKGVTTTEFEKCHQRLLSTQSLTRGWYKNEFPEANRQDPCNFTTIGGLFILLGVAEYAGRGVYRRK